MVPQYTDTLANITQASLVAFATKWMPQRPAMPAVPDWAANAYDGADNYNRNLQSCLDHIYGGSGPDPIASLNTAILNAFSNACHEWEQHGKPATNIPTWLPFSIVSLDGFNAWWKAYLATMDPNSPTHGQDPPPASSGPTQIYTVDTNAPWPLVSVANVAVANPSLDGPIGKPVPHNPSLFYSAGAPKDTDSLYGAGSQYSGPTGVYTKEIFNDPFALNNELIYWILTKPPAIVVPAP